jgi:hypothetical protein
MTTSCDVDFHARQQTRGYCDTADGLIQCRELHHDKDDVLAFYSQSVLQKSLSEALQHQVDHRNLNHRLARFS